MTQPAPTPPSLEAPATAGAGSDGPVQAVTVAGPAALPGIAAGAVEARAVAVGGIRAEQADVRLAAIGGVAASRADVRQGSVGGILASEAEISQGYVGTAAAGTLRVEQSFVRAAIANTFNAGPSTTVVFLVARRLEGSPRVLFDWRAAAVVAAAVVGLRLVTRIRR
jgi:hypothetical protein